MAIPTTIQTDTAWFTVAVSDKPREVGRFSRTIERDRAMNAHPASVSASDLKGADWFKSSYSNGGDTCVDVANGFHGVVPVRDSKDVHGPALVFSAAGWSSFLSAVNWVVDNEG
jgi:hypothetical protein